MSYKLAPVQDECLWENVIMRGCEWTFADESSYKEKLRDMYENYEPHLLNAEKLQEWVCETFTEENQYSQFVDRFLGKSGVTENEEWWDVVEYE